MFPFSSFLSIFRSRGAFHLPSVLHVPPSRDQLDEEIAVDTRDNYYSLSTSQKPKAASIGLNAGHAISFHSMLLLLLLLHIIQPHLRLPPTFFLPSSYYVLSI